MNDVTIHIHTRFSLTPRRQTNNTKKNKDKLTIQDLLNKMDVRLMDEYWNHDPAKVVMDVISIHDMWVNTLKSSAFIIYTMSN